MTSFDGDAPRSDTDYRRSFAIGGRIAFWQVEGSPT